MNGNQDRAVCHIWGHSRNPPIWPISPIQNWTRVTRWTPKDPIAARITGSLFGTILQWLQWRHNERDGISNHQRLDVYIKAPHHWSLWGEFTGDQWIPHSHRWITCTKASDAEHVSIWWRHDENRKYRCRRWVLLREMWSECSPVEMCFNEYDELSSERIWESPHPPTLHSSF